MNMAGATRLLDDVPRSQLSNPLYQSEFPFLGTAPVDNFNRPSSANVEVDKWRRGTNAADSFYPLDQHYQAGHDSRDRATTSHKHAETGGPTTPTARFVTDGYFGKNVALSRIADDLRRNHSSGQLNKVAHLHRFHRSESSPALKGLQLRTEERKSDTWTENGAPSRVSPDKKSYSDGSIYQSKHRSKKHKHKDQKKKKKKKRTLSSRYHSNESNSSRDSPRARDSPRSRDRPRSRDSPRVNRQRENRMAFVEPNPGAGTGSADFGDEERSPYLSRSFNDLDRSRTKLSINVVSKHRNGNYPSRSPRTPVLSQAPKSRIGLGSGSNVAKFASESPRSHKPRDKLPMLKARDLAKATDCLTGDAAKLKSQRFLRFTPQHEIQFPLEINKVCVGKLLLENKSKTETVAFKVKTNNQKRYLVRPAMSIIKPCTTINIQFIIQPDEVNTIFPHVEKKHFGGAKRKRDKFLVQSCALENDDMSTADQEKSLQSMWSLPRWKRKTANKKFYAKHFKMTLVSSTSDSSSDSDGADIDYNSPDASPDILTTQAPLDLSRRHSAEKKTMMWKQVGSKILSAVRVKGVGSSARNTAGVLRSLDERPILSPKAKKTRGYRTQTSKRASSSRSRASSEPGSSSLAVMSFSSDESGEDQEIEMKVAPFDGARSDQRSSSSSGLALPIKTLKTAGAQVQDDEIDILFSDHLPPWKWQRGHTIGQGQYGTVFLASRESDGQKMAMKEVELVLPRSVLSNKPGFTQNLRQHTQKSGTAEESDRKTPETLLSLLSLVREISVMQKLQHPNIVQYLGFEKKSVDTNEDVTGVEPSHDRGGGITRCKLRLFMEFVGGGSIAGLLKRLGPFDDRVVVAYSRQIIAGLKYLHGNGIAHRDIKGANLLLTPTGTIKLADFGTAAETLQLLTPRSKRSVVGDSFSKFLLEGAMGTPHWMAPEVARSMGKSLKEYLVWEKADIWSLGCTIIEMLTGHAPWYQKFSNPIAIIFHLANKPSAPDYPEGLSAVGREFLDYCFLPDAEDRPTVKKLLKHPYLRKERKKTQVYPPSKLQVMSPLYLKRKLARKSSTRSLDSLSGTDSSPKDSIFAKKASSLLRPKSQSSSPGTESPKDRVFASKACALIEKTRVGIGTSRNDKPKLSKAVAEGTTKKSARISDSDSDTNSSAGHLLDNVEAKQRDVDLSETAAKFKEDIVQQYTYPDAWNSQQAFEIEEIFEGTFRQWLFGHLDWVCKQAINRYLMTEEQRSYLLEGQYAEWDLRQVPSSPLLVTLQSASDVAITLLERLRAGLGLQSLADGESSAVVAAGMPSPIKQVPAYGRDANSESTSPSSSSAAAEASTTLAVYHETSPSTVDHGLVSFVWDQSHTWVEVDPCSGGFLVEWLAYARENLEYDRHVSTWLIQLRRRALYTARLQQCVERLECILYAFDDVLNKSDKERAKQLRTTLADSMREWCAYPDGEAYALLNVAYEQIEEQVQYIQEVTEGLWFEVEKQATAPFAYAYVCDEGWSDEEQDDTNEPEFPSQGNFTAVDQLDDENGAVFDPSTPWRCGSCNNKFYGNERNCWNCDLLIVYPDETWQEDYFREYYELVQKQQDEEYYYQYSFTSYPEEYETFDEDAVEVLPPAAPAKSDEVDAKEGEDADVTAEDDLEPSLNESADLDDYNFDEMTEDQYYNWYYGLGEYAVEDAYMEEGNEATGDAAASEANGTYAEGEGGMYDYDYSDSEYYQNYFLDGEEESYYDEQNEDYFAYQEDQYEAGTHDLELSADQMEFSYENDQSGDFGDSYHHTPEELDVSVDSYDLQDDLQEEVVVVALADYDAVQESEMSIRTGDVIQVLRKDVSGWWEGECNGNFGWFPSNYVQIKYDLFTISEEHAEAAEAEAVDCDDTTVQ